MKKLIISIVAIATLSLSSFGQAPEGFKYQAVVRDAGNTILNNQAVGIRMTILQGSIGGITVYSETFSTTTNAYGLVNLEIGSGTTTYDFTTIDWANGPYFMETSIDVTGGTSYTVMGSSQLLSVPYALHANTAENVNNDQVDDADADPNNEIQALSFSNDTLYLSNGGQVYMGAYAVDLVVDADADPTNEIQDISLNGTDLTITNGSTIDLSVLQDDDADSTNELQTISRTGTTVTLSNGGGTFEDSVGVYIAGTNIDITNNVISTISPCGLAIGQTYQGGTIFYLDSSGCHGLIVPLPDDIPASTTTWWVNGSMTPTNAIRDGIGAGIFNTERIIMKQGSGDFAAKRCANYQGGNFGDWYLPSKYELNLLYLYAENHIEFPHVVCWSSTEPGTGGAWCQDLQSGQQMILGKVNDRFAFPIRAF